MMKKNRPLSLSPYAEELFRDINFYSVFDQIKDALLKELESYNLRTKYDVQEMARYLFLKKKDDPVLDPLKVQVFKNGKNLDEIIGGAFIPLRDYYFEKHPEILD